MKTVIWKHLGRPRRRPSTRLARSEAVFWAAGTTVRPCGSTRFSAWRGQIRARGQRQGAMRVGANLSSCFCPLRSRYSILLHPRAAPSVTRHREGSTAARSALAPRTKAAARRTAHSTPGHRQGSRSGKKTAAERRRRGGGRARVLDVALRQRLVLSKLLAGDPPDVGLHVGRLGACDSQALAIQAQHLRVCGVGDLRQIARRGSTRHKILGTATPARARQSRPGHRPPLPL